MEPNLTSLLQRTTSKLSDSLKDNKNAENPGWYLMSQLYCMPNEGAGMRRDSYDSLSSVEGKVESVEFVVEEEVDEREVVQANFVSLLRRTSRRIATSVTENKAHLNPSWYVLNDLPVPSTVDDKKR